LAQRARHRWVDADASATADLLNNLLPSRDERTIFSQESSLVFEHVYEHYPEPNMGTYAHMQ
jgi:hypothetical protein